MEAVPRMPMISFELKTSCETPNFGPKLKQYIRDFYNEDGESYNTEIRQLESLRAQAVATQKTVSCCAVLKRYFCQLHFLQSRFPMSHDAAAYVSFSWGGVYGGSSEGDVRYEMAAVLHNVAALHTQLGAEDARANADGMKMCCTHFQCAAWACNHLREAFPEPAGSDMAANLLDFMERLCLAQAQECILEKSMVDSRKATIVAKVAVQVVEYYTQALAKLEQGTDNRAGASIQDIVGAKQFKSWKRYVRFKGCYHEALGLLYHGQQAEEQQKNGERVAYYQAAADKLREAFKLAKGLDHIETVNEGLALRQDVIEGKLKGARNENEFIYHEEVPERSALTLQKGASLVKGIPFAVGDPEVAGPDLFARLVPMAAHQAASLYSEELAALRRRVGKLVDEKDAELADFLSALRLDQLELHNQSDALPQELVDRCAALNARPGAAEALTEAVGKLAESCSAVDGMLTLAEQLLLREQQEEQRHRQLLGPEAEGRPPSIAATDLSREAAKYRAAHERASESNATLRKALAAHLPGLQTLSGPLDELHVSIPSMGVLNSSADEACITEMRRLAGKVSEMTAQRASLTDTLRAATARDDITAALVTRDPAQPMEALFQREMRKHQRVVNTLEQNLAAQANVLAALTEANARYAGTRRAAVEIQRSRESVVASLVAAYDAYQDLLSKSGKGLEFYRKLETNVSKLLQRVKGTCNVQDEERATIQAGLGVPPAASSATSRPKLKDYLGDTGGASPRLKDYLLQPSEGGEGGQRWPSIRPAPVGQEGSEQACPAGQSQTSITPSHQSYAYNTNKPTPTYQSYGYDSNKPTPISQPQTSITPSHQSYVYDGNRATPTHQSYGNDSKMATPSHQSYGFDGSKPMPIGQLQTSITPTHQSYGYDSNRATPSHQSYAYDISKPMPIGQSQHSDLPPSYASQFGPSHGYQGYAPSQSYASVSQSVSQDAAVALAGLSLSTNQTSWSQNTSYSGQTGTGVSQLQEGYSMQTGGYSGTTGPHQTGYPIQAGTNQAQTGYASQAGTNQAQTGYASQAGTNQAQTGYALQTGTNQAQTGYALQTGTNQAQTGYASQTGTNQAQTGYPSQAGTNQAQTGYPSQAGTNQAQTGYALQTGTNQAQTGYALQTGTNQAQTGYPSQAGTNQAQTGYPSQAGTNQAQTEYASQTGANQGQTGYASQTGTNQAQTGYPSQAGTNQAQTGYPSQAGTNQAQTGYTLQTGIYSGAPGSTQLGYSNQTVTNQAQTGYILQTGAYSGTTGSTPTVYTTQTGANQTQIGYSTQTGAYSESSGYPAGTLQTQAGSYQGHTVQPATFQGQIGYSTSTNSYSVQPTQPGEYSYQSTTGYPSQSLSGYSTQAGQPPGYTGQTAGYQAGAAVNYPTQSEAQTWTYSGQTDMYQSQPYTGSEFGCQPQTGTYVTAATTTTAGLASSSSVDLLAGLDFTAGPLPLTPSNQSLGAGKTANQNTGSNQPANGSPALSQPANQGPSSKQATNESLSIVQPANQGVANNQPANGDAASGHIANENAGGSQPANQERDLSNAKASPKLEPQDGRRDSKEGGGKDPYSEPEALRQFAAEVDKLDKFVEGLTAKTLNGPTPLDLKWKELLDLQEREGSRRSISVARCYPTKNRCADVLPYDDSRVELPGTKDDYINASHVTGLTAEAPAMIATQFPLPSTLNDFWTMIWQQQAELVVCLLADSELPDPPYWPDERGIPREVGEFRVSLQSRDVSTHVTRRIVTLSCPRGSRNLVLLQLTSWPGSSFPASPVGLLTAVRDALWLHGQQRGTTHPVVAHCAAGVGRTGLFCLLLAAVASLQQGKGLGCPAALAARLSSARRQALRDREHLRFAYQALLYHAQDVLLKRGVLGSRPGSFEGKRARHARHPSDDFVLASSETTPAQPPSTDPEEASTAPPPATLPVTSTTSSEDPLGLLDPYWRVKRSD